MGSLGLASDQNQLEPSRPVPIGAVGGWPAGLIRADEGWLAQGRAMGGWNMMTELFYEHLMKDHGKDPTGMHKFPELCY